MARWTEALIHERTDPNNLPGKQQGRLSADQVQQAEQILEMTRNTMLAIRLIAPDEEENTDQALDRAQELLLYTVAATIPEESQAAPGTYTYEN